MKMNKKQYNNVIEHTLKHEVSAQTGDSLEAARAIFNNMGVALPQGDIKHVYEVIQSDDYMGWKSCTMQEAQEAANNGTAAIGISQDKIVVLAANDEEETVVETAAVMSLSENTSAYAVDGLSYYENTRGATAGGKRKAIIIVPGVMGTELELATDALGFKAGTKVWPPHEDGEDDETIIKKLTTLECDENGRSVYTLRVRNTNNYGALKTYRKLYTKLKNTYEDDYDVVFLGYDWRKTNAVSGELLKLKVKEYDSVIIVAHSMGGLVTSHMLKDSSIRSKIAKVITLGTPYLGSLEMVTVMSHGELAVIDGALDKMSPIRQWLAKELVLPPIIKAMSVNIPSLYELLPTKKFFSLGNRSYYSIWYKTGAIKTFKTFSETRSSLRVAIPNFNFTLFDEATARQDSLWNGNTHVTSNVDTYYIVGESEKTPDTYTYYDETNGYINTSVSAGDGTVLSYSASMKDLYSGKTYFANVTHNDLVQCNDDPNIWGFIKAIIEGNTLQATGIKSSPQYTL